MQAFLWTDLRYVRFVTLRRCLYYSYGCSTSSLPAEKTVALLGKMLGIVILGLNTEVRSLPTPAFRFARESRDRAQPIQAYYPGSVSEVQREKGTVSMLKFYVRF